MNGLNGIVDDSCFEIDLFLAPLMIHYTSPKRLPRDKRETLYPIMITAQTFELRVNIKVKFSGDLPVPVPVTCLRSLLTI